MPYEAGDNYGTDFGLSNNPAGPWYTTRLYRPGVDNVPSDTTNNLAIYLKVPARYSGNNFQVEVTKCDAYGTPIASKITGLSSVYTAWKRVYVERDSMFRKGGLLHDNAVQGDSYILLYKLPNDTRWDNLAEGDKIAIFDTGDATGGSFEGAHDEAYIAPAPNGIDPNYGSPPPGAPHQVKINLVTARGGSTPYTLKRGYTASPPAATYYPDFSSGKSAGVGVVNSNDGFIYDTSLNRLPNGPGSAFYDPDMRDIEQPFDDGYVELIGLRNGMGAMPYLPQAFFDTSSAAKLRVLRFAKVWFSHCGGGVDWACGANNYFHAMGLGMNIPSDWGWTWGDYNETLVFTGTIAAFPGTTFRSQQMTLDHETGHQFKVNPCVAGCGGEDTNNAWCDGANHCSLGGTTAEQCLMNPSGTLAQREDGVNRFDTTDLLLGITSSCTMPCGPLDTNGNPTNVTYTPPAGAIRTDEDPQ